VFGARAGRAAAEYAAGALDPGPAVQAQARDEIRRLERLLSATSGGEKIADIRTEMQDVMEGGAGIYRNGESLAKAADQLSELQQRAQSVAPQDQSRTFNTELLAALELSFMLDLAECIVHSALRREESRGAHQRTDFAARDDDKYLSHSLVYRESDGTPRVDYLPVTITRWPPGERIYGK
jgi:fumarate reductase flavoprotein subunit